MRKKYTYISNGALIIELPEEFISGSVSIPGYEIEEISGSNSVLLDRPPEVGEELSVEYQVEKPTKSKAQISLEDKVLKKILETIKIQQDTIDRLEKAIKDRPTYSHVDISFRSIANRIDLLEEYIKKD